MRRFSYEGDHEEVTLYGVTFPQGEPVSVEDAFLQKKLEGNSHFREHESLDERRSEALHTLSANPSVAAVKRKPGRPRKER